MVEGEEPEFFILLGQSLFARAGVLFVSDLPPNIDPSVLGMNMNQAISRVYFLSLELEPLNWLCAGRQIVKLRYLGRDHNEVRDRELIKALWEVEFGHYPLD